jgi:hypothetical protein
MNFLYIYIFLGEIDNIHRIKRKNLNKERIAFIFFYFYQHVSILIDRIFTVLENQQVRIQ